MAIPEAKHHTIRTLHSLGFSQRAIASATGIPKTTLQNNYPTILGDTLIEDKGTLKMVDFKDATLSALAIESSEVKDKISALKGIDIGSDEGGSDNAIIDVSEHKDRLTARVKRFDE